MKKKKKKDFYRFVLIGRSGVGKTCMLAKMTFDTVDERFSCVPIPLDEGSGLNAKELDEVARYVGIGDQENDANADGSKNKRKSRKNRRIETLCERYYSNLGKDLIDDAVDELGKNQRPRATASTYTGALVNFTLNEKTKGDFHIRTMDYAGEHLNPDDLKKADSYSTFLKNHLSDYDGLLVVVETVGDGSDEEKIKKDVYHLASFFEAIKQNLNDSDRKNVTPAAIVLSKWDRFANVNASEEERKNVEDFLRSHSFYDRIVSSVRGLVQGQNKLENEELEFESNDDNVVIFPVSAFGNSVIQDDGAEGPDPNAKSFGLPEPFYFLATRRDELDLTALEEELAEKESSRFNIRKYWRVLAKCKGLEPRMKIQTDQTNATRLKSIRSRARRRFNGLFLSYASLMLCFAICCGGCLNYSLTNGWSRQIDVWIRQIEVCVAKDDPQATVEKLLTLQDDVNVQKGKFHGFGAESTAGLEDKIIEEIRKRDPEEGLWATILSLKDVPEEYLKRLEEYKRTYPTGKYICEATKLHMELQDEVDWKNAMSQEGEPERQLKSVDAYITSHIQGKHIAEAKALQKKLQDEVDWKNVTSLEGKPEQLESVDAYIASHPQGKYIAEAKPLQQKLQDEGDWKKALSQEGGGYEKQLERISAYVTSHSDGAHIDEATKLQKTLQEKIAWKEVQKYEGDDEKQLEYVKEYITSFSEGEHIAEAFELRKKLVWNQARSRYMGLYDSSNPNMGELTQALTYIVDNIDAGDEQVELLKGYPERMEQILNSYASVFDPPTVIEKIKTAIGCYGQVETKLSNRWGVANAQVVSQKLENLNAMLQEQIDDYDKKLYDDFKSNPTVALGEKYLDQMKAYNDGGAMREYVTKYLDYLERIYNPQHASFNLKIKWGIKAPNGKKPIMNVKFNGVEFINDTPIRNGKEIETKSADVVDLGSYDLDGVDPGVRISVDVDIYYKKYYRYPTKIGQCKVEAALADFQRPGGHTISLSDNGTELIVTSTPPEPPVLPEWSK